MLGVISSLRRKRGESSVECTVKETLTGNRGREGLYTFTVVSVKQKTQTKGILTTGGNSVPETK